MAIGHFPGDPSCTAHSFFTERVVNIWNNLPFRFYSTGKQDGDFLEFRCITGSFLHCFTVCILGLVFTGSLLDQL